MSLSAATNTFTKRFSRQPIRVLIVDDSAVVRRALSEIIAQDVGIEVVGTAPDATIARDKIERLRPDVLTLDVEMPGMDGITFLRQLMQSQPMPVVMISALTAAGAETTLQALALGAVDFITKPSREGPYNLSDYASQIQRKIRIAARAQLQPARAAPSVVRAEPVTSCSILASDAVIAIGASTGGTEAIRVILETLPSESPAIVIAQHIPAAFSEPFARRLDSMCALRVCVPNDEEPLRRGAVYIAPGDRHLRLERQRGALVCRLEDGPPINHHKPSVDALFRSTAEVCGAQALGVLLTGMGTDGAQGLKQMRETGACTVAQDSASSVVWGMPGEAVRLGAAEVVLPLHEIAKYSQRKFAAGR